MPHISASSFPPLVQSITDVTRRLSPSDVAATVIGTSSVTYLVLKRYEPQEYFFTTVFLIFLCVPALLILPRQNILKSTPLAVLAAYTSHWTLLLLFTAAYRLSPFHLLVGYPGPLLPRLTKWWTAYQIARHGQMHLKYQQLK
ncbi:hypothetical protein EWM64_g10217 [Hericium alpestre]|uniref:Uncharacterized protein n=1 Tax=Hericium alpestre TaxID=135208 RepID=A0A4Y9ZGD3_9AGAM|nr:hypothetical protein EWM64_g10217 [Hericium alpestre]